MASNHCNPCDRADERKSATCWCVNCAEKLCLDCTKSHKKNKASQHHDVISLDKISHSKDSILSLPTTCSIHEGKSFSFFCFVHDKLCCPACLLENHKQCEKVKSIQDSSKDIKNSFMFSSLSSSTHNVKEIVEFLVPKLKHNREHLSCERSKVQSQLDIEIKSLERKLNHVRKIQSEFVKMTNELDIRMKTVTDTLEQQKLQSERTDDDIKTLRDIASDDIIFIAAKYLEERQERAEKIVSQIIQEDGRQYTYEFKQELKSLTKINHTQFSISNVIISNVPEIRKPSEIQSTLKTANGVRLTHSADFSSYDYQYFWKCCFVPKHDLVVLVGNCMALFYSTSNRVVRKLQFKTEEIVNDSSYTWYVTKLDEDSVIISTFEGKLFKVDVVTLKYEEICKAFSSCAKKSIAYFNNTTLVYICSCDNCDIDQRYKMNGAKIIDLKTEKLLKSVEIDCDRGRGFISTYENKLLISNTSDILGYSLEGNRKIFEYKSLNNWEPAGVVADNVGNIYAALNQRSGYFAGSGKIVSGAILPGPAK